VKRNFATEAINCGVGRRRIAFHPHHPAPVPGVNGTPKLDLDLDLAHFPLRHEALM
jgi:hypothetical protein